LHRHRVQYRRNANAAFEGYILRKQNYFSCVEIDENVVLSLVPMPFTTVMMASATPALIKAYSMEVAPESSWRNMPNRPNILRITD
jgi:hypothetical protein